MPAPVLPTRTSPLALAVRLALAAAVIALLIVSGREIGGYVPEFAAWVESLGIWGPVAFLAGYLLATVAFVPGSLLTLAAGAIFGLGRGTALVFAGATLGATAAFLISRYAARAAFARRLADSPRFAAIDRAVARDGLRMVFLLRLSPVVPFNLLNYALGLTGVRLRDYLLASPGMLPATFLYVYLGKGLGSLAALAGGGSVEAGRGGWLLLGLGLAATALVTTLVTRAARRALGELTPSAETPDVDPS